MSVSRTLLATAAGVLFATSSFAADMMYEKAPTIAAPAPVFYDWTGVYGGLHAGYFWGDIGNDFGSLDLDGFMAGGQIGANWQFDQFVFGVEADLSWVDGDETFTDPGVGTLSAELNWLGTIRGRAGIAIDRFLVYGTGGVAFGGVDMSLVGVGPFAGIVADDDQTMVGWTVGAGVEAAMTENLSVKLEYLYVDLGDEDFFNIAAPVGSFDVDGHIVRAGLNYRFNLFQ